MNQPLVSVIVPCFKVEKYLSKCVNSILEQTYQNLEIILVDDGSPDKCGEICDEYVLKDSRVKVIHKQNGGLSDARNAAIDIAKGEWLTFIDSDDYVADDYVEILYGLAEKYEAQVTVAQCKTFVEGTFPTVRKKKLRELCWRAIDGVRYMYYQREFDNSVWSKLFHISLFREIRFPKGLVYEDDYVTYRLMFKAKKIAYCNKVIYFYLLRNNSIEGANMNEKKMDCALTVLHSLENEYWYLNRTVEDAFRCRYLSFCLHLLLNSPKDFYGTDELWAKVKKWRWSVLIDGEARKTARIAALLSYLGLDVLKFAYKYVDQRK